MACTYDYKGHKFNSEFELDNFLLSTGRLFSKYGDIVFSKSNVHTSVIEILEKHSKDSQELREKYNKAKEAIIDGEITKEFNPPFIGVIKFLSGLRNSDNELLFPEFIEKEYWSRRFKDWEFNNFTDDEKELFFEGKDTKPITSKNEQEFFKEKMLDRWKNQADIGTEVHKVLQKFFTTIKSGENQGKIFGSFDDNFLLNTVLPKEINPELLNSTNIKTALKLARELYSQITERFGENCTFYPEYVISGKANKEVEGKGDTILGKIDLLVIDEQGNAHVIDYKTSPKAYSDYSPAKKLAYTYQIAIYNRILERMNINVDNSEMLVFPIQLNNFRKEGEKYVFDECKPISESKTSSSGTKIEAVLLDSVKNRVETSFKISRNLQEFFPSITIDKVVSENLLKDVKEVMASWFPNQNNSSTTITDESIQKELEEADSLKDKDGIYIHRIGKKEITADSPAELFKKVKEYRSFISSLRTRVTKNLVFALKGAINKEDPNIEFPKIENSFKGINPDWLQYKLAKYCNLDWKLLECPEALELGIILLKNKSTGQLDVLRVCPSPLKDLKHIGGEDRTLLSGNFEPDIVQKSNSKSLMLPSLTGNIELMETMLVLNNLKSVFNKNTAIGTIEVINPYYGNSITASNEQLYYSFKTLDYHHPLKENNFKSKQIKMASKYTLALNTFTQIMKLGEDKKWEGDFKQFKNFESCISMFDSSIDEAIEIKLEKLEKLRLQMEETWDLSSMTIDQYQLSTKYRQLYNAVIIAIADLKGISFKQQVSENDKWLESSLIFKNGISGLYQDNPGNTTSETLNLLTRLVTEAYQNVRQEMAEPLRTIRNLVSNLKQSQGSIFQEKIIGNEASLFQNLIDDTYENDLVFRRLDDPRLSPAEKAFLEYTLDVINKNRYPQLVVNFDEMKKTGDIKYYRIPLAKGDLSSSITVDGLFKALKDKCKEILPTESLKRSRDAIEGVNRLEEKSDSEREANKSAQLFSIGVKFDRGEKESRLDYIKLKGKSYFEHNIETLLLQHIFSYSVKNNMDKVFPLLKAASIHLALQGANQNTIFNNDINYLKNFITNKIKNESIESAKMQLIGEVTNKLKGAASFSALALSPVQGLYQSLQGIWTDLKLIITKPDIAERSAFTYDNIKDAFISVYSDMFVNTNTPTKCSLLNELYGLNDMDMNSYVEKTKTDNGGLLNLNRFLYKFSQRPDYYNRGTIFGAQMRRDGTWEAHTVIDNKLVYNFKEDKRFYAFSHDLVNHPDYQKQRSLYYVMAQQFVNEHTKYDDGTEFVLDLKKHPPLPRAYTNQQADSYKSLADDIYGYYTHEKKSLMNSYVLGSLILQFKTYWTGKKNQYLRKGGVYLRGEYVHEQINGKYMYYVLDENSNITNEITDEDTGVPVIVWKGQWQEGIFITLADIFVDNPANWGQNFVEKWNQSDEMLRNTYRSNIKAFLCDMILWLLGGSIIAALMSNWLKELKGELKDSTDIVDALKLSSASVITQAVKNSFLDFNMGNSLINPVTTINPLVFDWGKRTVSNLVNIVTGDTSAWDGIMNSFSASRAVKPGLDLLVVED